MALTEQPLKKRKLYESLSEPQSLQLSFVPLSQEEILRKRRNREEIRSLYESYRRIRFCISHKDAHLMPEFEQAYLSLITASRGCTSVQRIVAELIPRYASYCPTALEAAAKVIINMYSWSLAVILRGEDSDGIAFQTAKACVFGLVDICCTASSEAPTSSVIRGICSAVFLNVLTFFVSSFEGKDIYQIGGDDIVKVRDSLEFFNELKQNIADKDESTLLELFKLRALSLLRIFFCCPKNLLAACFELFESSATDAGSFKGGNYFLRQVTNPIDPADATRPSEKTGDEARPCTSSTETGIEGIGISRERLVSDDNHVAEDASLVSKNCLMGMAIIRDSSLRGWIFSKYNKLCKSACSQAVSEISSALEGIFGHFSELVKKADSQEDTDEDNSDPSKFINHPYLMPRISNQCGNTSELPGRDCTSRVHDASTGDTFYDGRDSADKVSGQPVKSCSSVVPLESDIQLLNENSNEECEGSRSMKGLETGEHGISCHDRPSMRKSLVNNQLLSPVNKKPLNLRSDASEVGNHLVQVENNQISNADLGLLSRSTSGGVSNALASLEQHSAAQYHSSSTSQIVWYFDGDPAAMDVFSASKQLWLGSLGPDSTEPLVRFQLEKFGPIEQFLFFPIKGFALVEYRNIMDAIKAREYMRGSSPWGVCLRIKFLDIGLGSRGSINGVAIGASCHVYIGNVSSQWAKDAMLHELTRGGFRTPCMITDLSSESALLMEFETAEEAAIVMAHLRQHRKENGYQELMNKGLAFNAGTADVARSHMDGARFIPTPIQVEFRSSNQGSMPNSMVGSPHVPAIVDSPIENNKIRMSQLSSLLLSLSTRCNSSQSSSSFESRISRNYHATTTRDEDRVPTNTIWIGLPDVNSPFLTDDELMSVGRLSVGNAGSVVRLMRANMQMGSCWFIEFSSVDAAIIALKNLRGCPGTLFQIEFSQPGKHHGMPFINKSESSGHELVSPRLELDNRGTTVPSGRAFQSNWTSSSSAEMMDFGARKVQNHNVYDTNMGVDFSQAGHTTSHVNEKIWMHKKPEIELPFSAPGSMPCPLMATQGPINVPPHQIQASSYMRPVYLAPNNSWDNTHGLNFPLTLNHVSPGIMPPNFHVNVGPAPFLPASVTPLAQLPGNSMQHFEHMVPMPAVPPLSPPPPPPDMPPPLPPSPPPLPVSHSSLVPPPPSSPLQSAAEPSNSENAGQGLQHQWQGVLCKSSVHYCTIYAHREDSDACNYSNAVSEPAEWPARLDMTKRTDFQHVKSTFTNTPPHKREVCRLLPSTKGDHKGFQDFISYLRQRECAGVIKIPAGKSMWARLLFILPYSVDTCSMLAIAPHPSECLIALVLPKETNFDWV